MKKLALVGIVSILATVALSGCMSVPEEDVTPVAEDVADQIQAAGEEIGDSEAMSSYISSEYEFILDFPATWHGYEAKIEEVETARTITLSSKSDKERFIKLMVIDQGDHMPPLQLIGETSNYMVYVDDSMNDIEVSEEITAERDEIYTTFKAIKVINGYFTNAFSGGQLMYRDEDLKKNFSLTNSELGYQGFGLESYDTAAEGLGCPDFHAEKALFAVTNIEEEAGTAELVKVMDYYAPICDNPNEGGGGVADCAPGNSVSEKIDNFDSCSEKYEYGKDLIYGCTEEAKDLNAKMLAEEVRVIYGFTSDSSIPVLYKTANPDKLTKKEIAEIMVPCGELGSNQVLEATDDHIIIGYPYCTGGAAPDPELQPEQYAEYEDCMVVQDELVELYGL